MGVTERLPHITEVFMALAADTSDFADDFSFHEPLSLSCSTAYIASLHILHFSPHPGPPL